MKVCTIYTFVQKQKQSSPFACSYDYKNLFKFTLLVGSCPGQSRGGKRRVDPDVRWTNRMIFTQIAALKQCVNYVVYYGRDLDFCHQMTADIWMYIACNSDFKTKCRYFNFDDVQLILRNIGSSARSTCDRMFKQL